MRLQDTKWAALHMDFCAEKGVSWPPPVPASLVDNAWLAVAPQREVEIVSLACLDADMKWVDSSQTLTRARFCKEDCAPTVLPGCHLFHFGLNRFLIGRDLARLQGMPVDSLMGHGGKVFSENQIADLSGNAFSSSVSLAVDIALLLMAQCDKPVDGSATACELLRSIGRHDVTSTPDAETPMPKPVDGDEYEFEL